MLLCVDSPISNASHLFVFGTNVMRVRRNVRETREMCGVNDRFISWKKRNEIGRGVNQIKSITRQTVPCTIVTRKKKKTIIYLSKIYMYIDANTD